MRKKGKLPPTGPLTRSEVMSRVKAKDTTPELKVRSFLHRSGLRFRIHAKSLPGKPDVVFPSRRCVVFIHGCFWHRHAGCASCRTPKSRAEFWEKKFRDNVDRDKRVRLELEKRGWKVIVYWECETNNMENLKWLATTIKAMPTF
ncbi:MAG: very short patch repair endonuclease [Oryzomonas sp.]|uniref:very short patch repair endonuclease n=1 Tax=Oryzomonas sp. TaxID=2855186 RepID=UPI0028455924|nr:very short patch repair endonuclease [Oryzomonas sp.]MDR3579214.1 very short patch repair endonuclease [Oryzomonas sp.]